MQACPKAGRPSVPGLKGAEALDPELHDFLLGLFETFQVLVSRIARLCGPAKTDQMVFLKGHGRIAVEHKEQIRKPPMKNLRRANVKSPF